ncbi:hypothetical protein BV210_10070 [Halorientalis sp. IM1011]|uniref:hypothetical protein n=1 Tax=Halorientalis sp. IM1011 TaxID=1932360 RepID=UPI00097CD5CD|nr:hypothetical protein [Halorientalis sp. IM1011]AQL43041.1 hypothetical protein BV210_10070 [Halorientalis sp. IM1011]
MSKRYYGIEHGDSFRFLVQYLVATTAILLAGRVGVLPGSLEPLIRFQGFEAIIVPIQWMMYLVVAFAIVVIAGVFRPGTNVPEDSSGPGTAGSDRTRSAFDRVTFLTVFATTVGAVVGAGLIVAVPDWLSTVLPVVALSAAAVSLAFAGLALPERTVGTVLLTAGGTVFLLLFPIVTYPVLEFFGLVLAAVVALPALVFVRGSVRRNPPIDGRFAVAVALVFALFAGGAMAHDLSGPQPTVSLDHDSTVNLSEVTMRTYSYSDVGEQRATISVGALTVRNEFDFARTTDLPSYDVCLYGADGTELKTTFGLASVAEGDDWIQSEDEVRLPGESRHRYPVFVLFEDRVSRVPAEIRDLGPVPVRRAESCPETTDGPTLVLVPDDGRGRR